MQGYTDSVAFEFDSSILAKLHLVGVVTVVKNSLIFDEVLLNEFISIFSNPWNWNGIKI